MEALELLNDEYGHCGECHEVHYIPEMVAVDGYYYCKSCSRPTKRAADEMVTCPACKGLGYSPKGWQPICGQCAGSGQVKAPSRR